MAVPKLNTVNTEGKIPFKVVSPFAPMGDQPQAIDDLAAGVENGQIAQVLLGATGTGKTFTIAKLIEKVQKPTLVIAHNKTLAAQLASEFKAFFPDNYVGYFVSYYDYYQPEAYIASTGDDPEANRRTDEFGEGGSQQSPFPFNSSSQEGEYVPRNVRRSGTKNSGYTCVDCGMAITAKVDGFSKSRFGRSLCMDCQKQQQSA